MGRQDDSTDEDAIAAALTNRCDPVLEAFLGDPAR